MFQITFLGTGATVPSAERGLSSLLVEHGQTRYLVDCGEGTLRQMRAAHVGLRRLDVVLLTHGHLDHVLGLASLAGTLELWHQGDRLDIHGGKDALEMARVLMEKVTFPDGHPGLDVTYHPLSPGCFRDRDGVRVSAFPVRHHDTDSFGFLFEEAAHQPLDGDKLDSAGVPNGPPRQALARGEPATLPDGRTITPTEVLGEPERGARLAVVGDTEDAGALADAVRGVDVLVIEATYRTKDKPTARGRGHLTVKDAATLAKAAGVGRLVLTHQSDRYDPEEVLAEARCFFPETTIAKDFDRVRVESQPR